MSNRTLIALVAGAWVACAAPPSAERADEPNIEPANKATAEEADMESASDDWPMFRGDLRRTGVRDGASFAGDGLAERWTFDTGDKVESSPTVWRDRVFFGSFSGHLFAVDRDSGTEIWRFDTGALVRASPSVVGGIVYFGSDDNHIHALDAMSGEARWRFALGPGGEQSSPAVIDGTVYVGAFDQHLYALDAATGAERWRYATEGGILSSPAVTDGAVVIASMDGTLHSVDAATGASLWTFSPSTEPMFASPAIADISDHGATVFIGSYDDHVYAVDLATGEERWRFDTGGDIFGSPAVVAAEDGGRVFIGASNGFFALDAATGDLAWSQSEGGRIFGSPAIIDDRTLAIGTSTAGVLFYDLEGTRLGAIEVAREVWSSIFVDRDGSLYFGSHDGHVRAYAP